MRHITVRGDTGCYTLCGAVPGCLKDNSAPCICAGISDYKRFDTTVCTTCISKVELHELAQMEL